MVALGTTPSASYIPLGTGGRLPLLTPEAASIRGAGYPSSFLPSQFGLVPSRANTAARA